MSLESNSGEYLFSLRVIFGLYRVNGKENGNCSLGKSTRVNNYLFQVFIGHKKDEEVLVAVTRKHSF